MPLVDVGQSHIRYDSYGEGPPLVFAHGVGGNRVSWFKQVPHFCTRNQVVVFDHRAFGGSSDIEGEGRSRYVEDLLVLLDALRIDRAVLVGQSMGGGTCAAFTCRYPDRVRGLLIADSLAGIKVSGSLAEELKATRVANHGLSQVERVLGPSMRQNDPESTLLYLQLASFNAVNIFTVQGEMPEWSPHALAESDVPILFAVGEHDILFTPEQIRKVQSMIPGSQFALIEDAGHSAYFEQPIVFNNILDSFLASL